MAKKVKFSSFLVLTAALSFFIFVNAGHALAANILNVNSSVTGVQMTGTYPGTTNYTKQDVNDLSGTITVPDLSGNYAFTSWSGCDSTSNYDCTVSVIGGATKTISATYKVAQAPPCGSYGDVNGDGKVTTADALWILRFIAGLQNFTATQIENADVDDTPGMPSVAADVTSIDSIKVLRYVDYLDSSFTACGVNTLYVKSSPVTGVSISGTYSGTTSYNKQTSATISGTLSAPSTFNSGSITYNFSSWSGCNSTSGTSCTVSVSGAGTKSVTANYTAPNILNVKSSPITGISISGVYPGITNYTKTSSSALSSGMLTAPDTYSNYSFISWSGCDGSNGRNCTIGISGGTTKTATANYKITKTPPCASYGDVNSDGKVTFMDGEWILQFVSGSRTFASAQIENADVDDTPNTTSVAGDVTAIDSQKVLRYIDGLDSTFPVCSTAAGSNTLNVNSSPVAGVSITGTYSGTTNYTKQSSTALSGTNSAPSTVIIGGVTYNFSSWSGCDSASSNSCTVTVSGGATKTITANYSSGSGLTPPCDSYGDVDLDGFVTAVDALKINRFVALLEIPTAEQKRRGDVDGDNELTAVDALKVLRYVSGLETTFAVCGSAAVNLTANPTSSPAPLATTLTMGVTGGIGTINYNLWWNCSSSSVSVATVQSSCGALPAPALGSCAENSNGYRCNAVSDISKSILHTYSSPGSYRAYAVVERSSSAAGDWEPVTVSQPVPGSSNMRAKLFILDNLQVCNIGPSCINFTLDASEVSAVRSAANNFVSTANSYGGGKFNLQLSVVEITDQKQVNFTPAGAHWWLTPYDIDSVVRPYITKDDDFVLVANNFHDKVSGRDYNAYGGGTVGVGAGIGGAAYTNVQVLTSAVMVHEWLHQVDSALEGINGVTDIYQDNFPQSLCGNAEPNTYKWFPSADTAAQDPDFFACQNYYNNWGGYCTSVSPINCGEQWDEHIVTAHYPSGINFIGNYCRDGRKDYDETGVDSGGQCAVPPLGGEPNPPFMPTGPTSGTPNTVYQFNASAVDPQGDKVKLTFSWSDGGTSTSGLYINSGSVDSAFHSWQKEGTYYVTAKACDTTGACSGQSAPLKVVISAPIPQGVTCDGAYLNDKFNVCYFDGINPSGMGTALAMTQEGSVSSPAATSATPINHDWGTGNVGNTNKSDQVSGIWRGRINFPAGDYIFSVESDDGVKLWINNNVVIDQWKDQAPTVYKSAPQSLNGYADILLKWYENNVGAKITLGWAPQAASACPATIAPQHLYDQENSMVFVITDACQKRWINSPDSFNNCTYDWDKIEKSNQATLDTVLRGPDVTGQPDCPPGPLNGPPMTPWTPQGPTSGQTGTGYSYSTWAYDSDWGLIKYILDWGDGTASETPMAEGSTNPQAPNPVSVSHVWGTAGTYQVKARACDVSNACSAWSDPLGVNIQAPPSPPPPPPPPPPPSCPNKYTTGGGYGYAPGQFLSPQDQQTVREQIFGSGLPPNIKSAFYYNVIPCESCWRPAAQAQGVNCLAVGLYQLEGGGGSCAENHYQHPWNCETEHAADVYFNRGSGYWGPNIYGCSNGCYSP